MGERRRGAQLAYMFPLCTGDQEAVITGSHCKRLIEFILDSHPGVRALLYGKKRGGGEEEATVERAMFRTDKAYICIYRMANFPRSSLCIDVQLQKRLLVHKQWPTELRHRSVICHRHVHSL